MDKRGTLIAIADEDPHLRELYGLELSDRGYEVVAVSDLESTQELIASCKPDLVLLDPYDGNAYRWDVLADIRGRNYEVPILICVPFEMGTDYPHGRYADACIIKSFDVSGLVSKVQLLLGRKAPGRVPVEDRSIRKP